MDWSQPTPYKMSDAQPGIIARLLRRFIMGLSVVGITSAVQWMWSMSLTSFMRFGSFRGLRDRRSRERSALSLIIIAIVIAGAARTLLQVYKFVERKTKQWLTRAEYNILEVGD